MHALWTAGRPMDAFVSVANPTPRPLTVRVRLAFSTGRTRTTTETLAVGETFGARVWQLFGSQRTEPTTTLTGLTVTCEDGRVACPVSVSLLTAPTCEVVP